MTHVRLGSAALLALALLFSTTTSAVEESTHANAAWTPWGLGRGTIQALALDPEAGPAGVCMAPQLGGVLCSTNGGSSWEPQNTGLAGANVVALAASTTAEGLLAATAGGALYRRDGAVWQLVNDGHLWGPLSSSLLDRPFGVLLLPSVARGNWPAQLYLTAASRVFLSDDGGASWRLILTTAAPVSDFAVDPVSPRVLYAASHPDPNLAAHGPGGLLKSVDGGAHWKPIGPAAGWPTGVLAVAASAGSPGAPAALYVAPGGPGLLRSHDRGGTWETLSTSTFPESNDLVTALAVDPASPATVVAARADGLFLSRDGGDSWSLFGGHDVPFVPWDVTRLVIGPGAQRLYAPTHLFGLFATASRGRRWTTAYPSVEADDPVGGRLRFDPADPQTAVAVFDGLAYRSNDGGASWTIVGGLVNQGAPLTGITDIAFGPPATPHAPNALYAATGAGLVVSGDGGETWRDLGLGGPASTVAILAPRTFLAADCGAFLTNNGGRTWRPTLSCDDPGNGVPSDDFARLVDGLVVDPTNSQIVYARVTEVSGLDGTPPSQLPRVFRSADGGVSWRSVLDGSNAVAVDPGKPGVVYLLAGTTLQRSTNHGQSFTSIRTTGLDGLVTEDLAIDSGSSPVLYAAGQGGVRQSSDGGRSWAPADQGLEPQEPLAVLTELNVSGVFLNPASPGRVFAAANGAFYQASQP